MYKRQVLTSHELRGRILHRAINHLDSLGGRQDRQTDRQDRRSRTEIYEDLLPDLMHAIPRTVCVRLEAADCRRKAFKSY